MIRLLFFCFLIVSSPVWALNEDQAPESATGEQHSEAIQAQQFMAVTAHPLATEVGYKILKSGGSAADAAVAIQAMLTLVEPQSSGIGGGAFMLYWDNENKQLYAYDGRETAPSTADENLFIKPDGDPMNWYDALVGGRSVGTPGVLKMLELAHIKHGKTPWHLLYVDTVKQARKGFEVGPRLHQLIKSRINPGLDRYVAARKYFFTPEGEPLPVGTLLKNPVLANSLAGIARSGVGYFYLGPLARQIINSVQAADDNPGHLSLDDLADYRAQERDPICLPYQRYKVCGFPPPTSGGVTVLQILKLLENQPLAELDPQGAQFNHLFTQASRLAYADRARYLADADFVDVPVEGLLDETYLERRRQLISPAMDSGKATAGNPQSAPARQDDQSPELPSTSHFVVVDKWGNAVSMTTSIEMAFGSTLMAGGFLLNNQLTDFSFVAEKDGELIANRVQAGKRPRSSMSPFMVFDKNDQLIAAIGSPGGSRIINYVAQSLLVSLNHNLPLQQVVNLPHISNRNSTTELEENSGAAALAPELEAMGHTVNVRDLNSGLHGMHKDKNGVWHSAVDKRREGSAKGN
ncbi:gamma-glutamyltransferase [Pontibacterium granulatum]|uniref:gamma-glutamyltransferase n=1 Tax=Pontibacterium granulatum TaxID=2036029 RepID=UPI00249BCCA0|nr:gamma-glutamyltransferase [Pontibacterium granulatum]MDI3325085.1 gamma-glutamyltransferase [Pontibacterium granulatum]